MPDQENPKPKTESKLDELNLRARRKKPISDDDEDAPASRRGRGGEYFEGASSIFEVSEEAEIEEEPEEELETPPSVPSLPKPAPPSGNEKPEGAEAAGSRSSPNVKKVKISGLEDALRSARGQFQDQNFEECIRLLNEILMVDPSNSEAYGLLNEAQAAWEEEKQQKEWLLHLQHLRREALKLWEEKRYEECHSKFKVLNQSDPDNKEFKRLLVQCEEEIRKKQEADSAPSPQAPVPSRFPVYPDEVSRPGQSPTGSAMPGLPLSRPPKPPQPAVDDLMGRDFLFGESQVPPTTTPLSPNGKEPRLNSLMDSSEPPSPPIRLRRDQPTGPNWKNIAIGVTAGVMILLILGIVYQVAFQSKNEVSSLELHSQPEGAIVKIKDLITAQTPLYLGSIPPGHYQATLEKEGYLAQSFAIDISPGQAWSEKKKLDESRDFADISASPENARASLAAGRVLEAARIVNEILARDPTQGEALHLKEEIRGRLNDQASRAMAANRWEEARYAWESLLRVFPEDAEAQEQLRTVRGRLKKQAESGRKTINPQQARIQTARDQLSAALNAGNFFPPASGNALEGLRQLESLSPGDPLVKEASEKIQGSLLSQASRKIQARSWEEARSLLRQFQANFPESSEFRTVRDSLRNEEARVQDQKNTLVQHTESAYASRRYVTPANENVVTLANRVLSLEPQNSRMMALKRESLRKAAEEAREMVKRWKYDDAYKLYQALLSLSSTESNFPLDIPQLKGEAEKIEFRTFPVIHDHGLVGSCSGTLRVNGYVISYVPAGDSKDGFIERISEIQQIETGDKLKLRIAGRQYRFQANGAESKEDNRQKIQLISQELRRLAPATR